MIHFDFLRIGTVGLLEDNGIDYETIKYLLVLVEGLNSCTWLEPTAAWMAAVIAEAVLRLCTAMGVPKFCTSGTTWPFKN